MSANLVVDIGGTCVTLPSLPGGAALSPSGQFCGLSGQLVGDIVDLLNANTFTNVYVHGQQIGVGSGPLLIGIQTSDSTASGSFTDPTSGLPPGAMPTAFSSGGWLIVGSGGGVLSAQVSGQNVNSGFCAAAGFLMPHRYARLLIGSGSTYIGPVAGSFIKQQKTTGSGGGFSQSPLAATPINV